MKAQRQDAIGREVATFEDPCTALQCVDYLIRVFNKFRIKYCATFRRTHLDISA